MAESGLSRDWTPAFAGQRPPFEKGNTLQLRHGAKATVHLAPRAEEIADGIREIVPAYSVVFEPAIRLLSLTLARVEAATRAIDRVDEASADSALKPYTGEHALQLQRLREDCRGWLNTSRRLMNDLGMTPVSAAKLGYDLARTEDVLLQIMADGREQRAAS